MLYNDTLNVIPLNVYQKACNSCIVYIVLFVIFLITNICICCIFINFYWHLKKNNTASGFSVGYLNVHNLI